MFKQKIVAIIPALNEEETISKVIRNVKEYVDEVILVDDASIDRTPFIAKREGIIVFSHQSNQGYDKSIDDGFVLASKIGATIILTFDGDGQHNPNDIPKIIAPIIEKKADVVVGKRPHYSRLVEYLFSIITRVRMNIDDPFCGFKAYHVQVYNDIGYFDKISSIGTQLMFNAKRRGYRIVQVDIKTNKSMRGSRFGGKIKSNLIFLRAFISVLRS